MKHLLIGSLFVLYLTSLPSLALEPVQLQGSWILKSAVYTKADGTVIKLSDQDMKSIKLVSKAYFSFVTVNKDGSFNNALTGRYQLQGDSYKETPEAGSVPAMLNKTYEFKAKLDGDLWHHSGMEDGTKIEELWQRLD
jgi:hypothetical protein